jgi:pimeloyl-ACP methyl ester carboxylesterase
MPRRSSYYPAVQCDLGRIAFNYETEGKGRPILMLHGWPLDHTQLAFEMERHFVQRSGWRRIYVDLPGMGKTPGPDWITCGDQVLEVLEQFVDSVIGGDRFVLAGSSYGAYLALGLAHRRAGSIEGLLLSVPGLLQEEDLPAFAPVHKDQHIIEAARSEGIDWMEHMAVSQTASVLEYSRVLEAVPPADERFLARLFTAKRFSFDTGIMPKPFLSPVLILTGRQDSVCGYEAAWRLLEMFPRATFAVLDGAGHLMWGGTASVVLSPRLRVAGPHRTRRLIAGPCSGGQVHERHGRSRGARYVSKQLWQSPSEGVAGPRPGAQF